LSIFEPHTDLIVRGKLLKPIETGHQVLLSETPEKFITDYFVFNDSVSDSQLLPIVIKRHKEIYHEVMKILAADKGFHPGEDEMKKLCKTYKEIEMIAVPARRSDYQDEKLVEQQQFRAGIEGTISCLKRAFRLARSYFHGFKGFCRSVGSAVFCHNLRTIARQET